MASREIPNFTWQNYPYDRHEDTAWTLVFSSLLTYKN